MTIKSFNLKMNDELASSLENRLLPVYRGGDVKNLISDFEEKGLVSTMEVRDLQFDYDIKLDMRGEDSHATDAENIKLLYERLKDLPPSIAAKPDFWGWYAHAYMSDYVIYRSETKRKDYDKHSVLRDFFCRSKREPPRRMLVVNLLARLWWTGRMIYDKQNKENPYHFVDLLTKSAYNSKILLLASSTASSNHEVCMGLLDAVEQHKIERQLDDVTRDHFIPCTKRLNSIGAVRMIDTLSREEIRAICLDVLNPEDGSDDSENYEKK